MIVALLAAILVVLLFGRKAVFMVFFIGVAFCVMQAAQAQQLEGQAADDMRVLMCSGRGATVSMVLQSRNNGMTPQQTYTYIHALGPFQSSRWDDATLKNLINATYFDKKLEAVTPRGLGIAVEHECLFPNGEFADNQPVQ